MGCSTSTASPRAIAPARIWRNTRGLRPRRAAPLYLDAVRASARGVGAMVALRQVVGGRAAADKGPIPRAARARRRIAPSSPDGAVDALPWSRCRDRGSRLAQAARAPDAGSRGRRARRSIDRAPGERARTRVVREEWSYSRSSHRSPLRAHHPVRSDVTDGAESFRAEARACVSAPRCIARARSNPASEV
jgi:hypothetical protein